MDHKIVGIFIKVKTLFFLFLYYTFFRYLPASKTLYIGFIFKRLRYACCKNIFKFCGKNVNIERMAFFGSGFNLEIGNNSGLGINCVVPSDIFIGENVMMGPNVHILSANHKFDRIDIPMCRQGHLERKKTKIEGDVWVGMNVIFTPGRTVRRGSIIAAGTVLSRDFEEYSIVGGNPSKLIKSRTGN